MTYSLGKATVSIQYHSPEREPGLLEKRADFKAWAGEIQDKPEMSCGVRD